MSPLLIGTIGFIVMVALALLEIPIFVSLGLVGVVGLILTSGFDTALGIVASLPFAVLANYGLAVVPLFFLMGQVAGEAGIVTDAYEAVYKVTGRLRGGLAMATTVGSAFSAATMGSSVANAALFTRVALPEMLKFNYDKNFSLGCIASAGTFAIMIPPSIMFVIYGVITEESIGRLLIAGIVPGILTAIVYLLSIWMRCKWNPKLAPAPEAKYTAGEQFRSVFRLWSIILLFSLVFGGIYFGFFTASAGAAIGASGAFLLALGRKKLTRTSVGKICFETMQGLGPLTAILIGGFFLGRFLVLCGFVESIIHFVTKDLAIPPLAVIGLIAVMYLILGALMDELSMTLVTVPFVYPLIKALGFDGIWFGVIYTKLCQIGLIFPPIAMNLFVVASAAGKGTTVIDVIKGIFPFILLEIIVLTILILFPSISLYLPSKMYGG
jgi:tripartite ATP-independent transporter DctM subunit